MTVAATPGGGTQETIPTNQKSGVPLKTLSLIVTDSSDHSIDTLRKEDIQLLEDGIPQPISLLSKDDRPVSYGIVIDRSGSFRQVLEPAMDAAKSLVNNNRPGDETFIVSFVNSDKIETVEDFTTNKTNLLDGLDTLYVEAGYSAIIDAVYLAVASIAERRKGADSHRRALVLLTDGDNRNNFYQLPALEKLLLEKDVQIFVIGFVSEVSVKPTDEERMRGYRTRDEAVALLTRIAAVTGGRVFFPNSRTELARAAAEIDRDLLNGYSIAYQPAERKTGFHRVTVQITAETERDRLRVITRPGYFIPTEEKTKNKGSKAKEKKSP